MKVRGVVVLENGTCLEWIRFCETEEEAIRLVLAQHPGGVVTLERDRMMAKSYRYLIKPLDGSFEPLYVKTLTGVLQLLRDYPGKRFSVVSLESGSRTICIGRHV